MSNFLGDCAAPPVYQAVKKGITGITIVVVLVFVLCKLDNDYVIQISFIEDIADFLKTINEGTLPLWTDLIGIIATSLSIILSILAAWPYFLIYRKLASIDSAPLKFTYLALGSNTFGLYCGIKMADSAIINTTRFNLIWLGMCYLIREYCSFSHGESPPINVTQRLLNVIAALLLIVEGLDLMSEVVRDFIWVLFQIAPNMALALDYRKAYISNNIQGVSLPMLIACVLCSLFWTYYGILRESIVLIVPPLSGVIFPCIGFVVYYSLVTRNGRAFLNKLFMVNQTQKSITAR